MKILTIILTSLLLTGIASADINEDYKKARKMLKEARKSYNAIRFSPDFDKKGEYEKADVEYTKAVRNWSKVRKEHPVLKKFADEEKRYMSEMAKLKPGSDEFEKIKLEYQEHWKALNKASVDLPELKVARARMDAAATELKAVEERLVAASPEATAAYAKVKKLKKEKIELRKKIKAQKK